MIEAQDSIFRNDNLDDNLCGCYDPVIGQVAKPSCQGVHHAYERKKEKASQTLSVLPPYGPQ